MKKILIASAAAVIIAMTAIILFRPSGTSNPAAATSDSGGDTSTSFMFLAADDAGAIISGTDSVVGLSSSGRTIWKEKPTSGVAVCSESCPNAILTGDIDALNSPLVKTPPPLFKGTAVARVEDGFQVWAPVRLGSAVLVVRTSKSGITEASWTTGKGESSPARLPGRGPMWNGPQDGPGILTTTDGKITWATIVTAPHGRPTLSPALTVAGEGVGCAGPDGRALLPIGNRAQLVDQQGRALPTALRLRADDLGSCTISPTGIVASAMSEVNGKNSPVLSFFDTKGVLLRTVKDSSEPAPMASRDGSMISFRTPQGIAVATPDGTIRKTYRGAIQSLFTRSGTLVLLYPDGHVEWRKNP